MTSNEKSFNIKVVRLVETVDSDIKIVLIRGRMQKLQPVQDAATPDGRTLGKTIRVLIFSVDGRTLRGRSSGF